MSNFCCFLQCLLLRLYQILFMAIVKYGKFLSGCRKQKENSSIIHDFTIDYIDCPKLPRHPMLPHLPVLYFIGIKFCGWPYPQNFNIGDLILRIVHLQKFCGFRRWTILYFFSKNFCYDSKGAFDSALLNLPTIPEC